MKMLMIVIDMKTRSIPQDITNDLEDVENRTFWWHFHRLSGVAIIFLLGFHVLFVMTEKGATINSIQQRVARLGYVLIDILMLIIVLYHGLNGTRLILQELLDKWYQTRTRTATSASHPRTNEWLNLLLNVILIVLGIFLVLYGTAFILMLSPLTSNP